MTKWTVLISGIGKRVSEAKDYVECREVELTRCDLV